MAESVTRSDLLLAVSRSEDRPQVLADILRKIVEMHPIKVNPTYGCCAPPKLCNGHPPECGGKGHHWNDRPKWPCDEIKAVQAALGGES